MNRILATIYKTKGTNQLVAQLSRRSIKKNNPELLDFINTNKIKVFLDIKKKEDD
jgi:hypothetical protein